MNEQEIKVKYNGADEFLKISMRLIDGLFRNADETAYLIYSGNELKYVGEYSYNLADRWLRNGNYVWHHKDKNILAELEVNKVVSLWLAVDPYLDLPNKNGRINVSKSIEQEVMRQNPGLEWNGRGSQVGKIGRKNNCMLVSEIIDKLRGVVR